MKKAPYIFAMLAASIAFTSCKDKNQEQAEKLLDNYIHYIDSVSDVAEEKAAANWEAIEDNYNKAKLDAEIAITNATDKEKIQVKMDQASMKYEEFKMKVVTQKAQMDNSTKVVMYKSFFGPAYVNDDMKFNWVNKDNILSVYDNFVTTVQKNKDSYSREDWDEIKLVYEALDTRKNTVENEGLSGSDNRKIAALKIKFAPMYTVNRMGSKSEENAEAKE